MKSLCHFLLLVFLLGNGPIKAQTKAKDGWQPLFDGESLSGWRQAQKDTFPDAAGVSHLVAGTWG